VVGLLRDVWQTVGLDVYVFPYGVLPTKYECGIIQARALGLVLRSLMFSLSHPWSDITFTALSAPAQAHPAPAQGAPGGPCVNMMTSSNGTDQLRLVLDTKRT